jgi:hypothetical protein
MGFGFISPPASQGVAELSLPRMMSTASQMLREDDETGTRILSFLLYEDPSFG